MIIEKNVEDKLRQAAYEHLLWTMKNKGAFLTSYNISTVQYMNERGLKDAVKFNYNVVKSLEKFDRNSAFLNIGSAAGLLEYTNKVMKEPITMLSVEWDEQYLCCKKIREVLGINISYICNDVLDDNFEIFDCENYFDYVIMQRFFPIYHSSFSYRLDDILEKMSLYAEKAIIIESDSNWAKEQYKKLESVSEKRQKVSGDWSLFVINLDRYRK